MILTGKEIKHQVANNRIHIKPFCHENVNPNSYNYRLDNNLFELTGCPLDAKAPSQLRPIEFNDSGYVLNPNKLYLANTYEEIGSDYFVTSLIGRSSLGRLGVFLQITADLGNIGAKHKWTLEIKCVQPIRIYPQMLIGQVTFWQPEGECGQMYQGKYARYSSAHSSEIHQEFNGAGK